MKARVEENRDRHAGVAERAASESEKLNPFPGPQPYARGQSGLFFGRSDSVAQLTSLLLSSHIVLLHAPSGSGKSSLLNAGLYPRLEQLQIPVVASIRFARERRAEPVPAPADTVTDPSVDDNPFTERVVQALLGTDHARSDVKTISDAVRVVEAERDESILVMVLDQFEEIFLEPLLWHAREELLTQLADAVRLTDRLRVIIGMRSDFLASLIPHERQLPSQLMVRIGLQSLKEPAARRVIQNAFERTGVAIEESELNHVLDALFTSSPETGPIGVRSEFANLIQLQIVCRRLWEQLWQRQFVVGGPYHGSIPVDARASMAAFVDEAVTSVSGRARLDEGWVRNWLETLVLPGKRRALISLESPSAPQSVIIDELERARLIRIEMRNESRVAELTHDSMVDALLESNGRWRRRQRKSRLLRLGLSVVMLAALLALFVGPLTQEPSGATIEAREFNSSTPKPYNLEFVGTGPYAVAELWSSGSNQETAAPTVTISEVEPGGDVRDILPSQRLAFDSSGYLDQSIAFKTAVGTRYRLTIATEASSLDVNVNVRGYRTAQKFAEGERETEFSVAPYENLIGELPPGAYNIHIEDGYGMVYAEDVLTRDDEVYDKSDTIVVIDRNRFVVISAYSSSVRVKISRLVQLPLLRYNGGGIRTNEVEAIAEVNVGWHQLPAVVTADCSGPVVLLGYSGTDVSIPKIPSSQSTEGLESGQYLLTAAGRHRLRLKSASGDKAICEVQVQPHGEIINHFGRVSIPMKTGAPQAAIALQLPAEGLIIAPTTDRIAYSLTCSDGRGVDTSIRGAKFIGSLPPSQTCILAMATAGPLKSETIHVDVHNLPGARVPGGRR